MPDRISAAWPRFLRVLGELVRGAAGTGGYDRYLEHCRRHHPDEPTLTRQVFFREQQAARWEGVSRCC